MALIHKTLVRSAAEFAPLRRLWHDLFTRSSGTVFQRFEWNLLAAELFGEHRSPAVAVVEGDTGAAIIPACVNVYTESLELLGEALFDYRDILHDGSPDTLNTAWEMLADFNLPLSVTAIQPEAAELRWVGLRTEEFVSAPWVDAASLSEAEFRGAHPRVGSRLRKILRKGVSIHEYSGADRALVQRLYQLKCDQFPGDVHNLFRDRTRREFMAEIAAQDEGTCRIYTLQDSVGCIVAGLVTFCDEAIRRFYTIYFDPAWAPYSPGVALVFEVTARSLAQGLSCDYMTGEYPYKMRFANASRLLYRVEASAEELAALARPLELRRVA
jgi:CelD/BcsL family acetyltransferase involved in cellulose biosynthesis